MKIGKIFYKNQIFALCVFSNNFICDQYYILKDLGQEIISKDNSEMILPEYLFENNGLYQITLQTYKFYSLKKYQDKNSLWFEEPQEITLQELDKFLSSNSSNKLIS